MFEEKFLEPHFTSVLAPYMLDVVEQKRALGNKYNAGVEALSAFDDFCNEQQLRIPAISKELLQKWEKKRPHENETTQCFRISYVRILCKYLHSNGYDAPCAFHPAPHVNKCFVPYIFTKDEIERLFSAVDCTKESSESPLRHLVMPVLFRLLYTCGLRVSEALHLKVADVDLDAGVLAIYGAKGDKERLVGISDSMLAYMKSYRSNPLVANAKSIYFFPTPDGGFYDTSTIYDIFRKCLFDAGIPHRGRGKGPRLHDLRHSFTKPCAQVLRQYICENHLDIPERRNDQLFTNPQGKKLTRSGVSYVLAKYIHKANTAVGSFFPQITPHCLRHSKAMHLVEAGKNLIYIRDFLGHESIETTQVYAKANPEARRKALETMDTRMNTPAMPDWNDDPDLKAFLKTL